MSKVFLDTNILVHGFDESDKRKHRTARERLLKLQEAGTGVLSTQVLQEFYVSVTKKIGMDPLVAKSVMESFDVFETVVISPSLIGSAADYHVLAKISFWDAMIIAAAEIANCERVWSEDFNHDQVIRGIRIENPFR